VLADDYVIRAPNTKAHTLNKAEVREESGSSWIELVISFPTNVVIETEELTIVFLRLKWRRFCIIDMCRRCVCITRESWPLSVYGLRHQHPTSSHGQDATAHAVHGGH
jgi:hypothetical protein